MALGLVPPETTPAPTVPSIAALHSNPYPRPPRWAAFRKALPIYLFMSPGLILFCGWTLYPLASALVMSFFQWNLIKPSIFIGLDNYTRAFNDPVFWQSLVNTVAYALITVPGQIILGLGAAVLLNQKLPLRGFFRTLFYLPVVTSWLVVSLVFLYLYNSQAGLINYLLKDVLHVMPTYQAWLQNPGTALPAIAALGIWKGLGWTMVIFLAGMQSVPPPLHEAAAVDGATTWRRFWYITLPLLRPTFLFVIVMLSIGAFNAFIQVFVMTAGGPQHSTEVLLTYMYNQAFKFLDLGYGAALSYIFAIGIFVISLIEIRFLRKPIEY